MKITGIDIFPIHFSFSIPFQTAAVRREGEDFTIVKIRTDEGVEGVGEATSSIEAVDNSIKNAFGPALIGEDPFEISRLVGKMIALSRDPSSFYDSMATTAIEIALIDLKARSLNTPVYNLFGGKVSEKVKVTWVVGIQPPSESAEEARRYVEKGFKELKLKVGLDDSRDIKTVKAVREAVGLDIPIRVDANQAWSVGHALRMIRRLGKYDLQAVEQPVAKWDLDGLCRVRSAVDIPIEVDESLQTCHDAIQIAKKNAADIFNVKLFKGVEQIRDIIRIGKASGIGCVLGSAGELGIGQAMGLHLAAAERNIQYGVEILHAKSLIGEQDVILKPLKAKNGYLNVPTSPGLGVELDEEQIRRHLR